MTTAQLRRVQRVEAREAAAAEATPAWATGAAATAFVAAPLAVAREWHTRALMTMRERRPPEPALFLQEAVYEANMAGALRTPEQEALVAEWAAAMEEVWADRRQRAALIDLMRREPWQGWAPSTEGLE